MIKNTTKHCIVEAADRLFYEQGFEHTSFAQIATAVGISRGNFYYHFKTKNEILDAVINYRLAGTNSMLDSWEASGETPADRIHSFINMLMINKTKIKRYGCPVGTLCTELMKLNHPANSGAKELFTLFRAWLKKQFEQLGQQNADALAMHILALSQGIATLASTFQDEKFIRAEVAQLHEWIDSYSNGNKP